MTGIALNGRVCGWAIGCWSPLGREMRIRGIYAQNRPADEGSAGQRCALNLAALAREAIGRGDRILDPALHLSGTQTSIAV